MSERPILTSAEWRTLFKNEALDALVRAEALLRAANARVGVAEANLYPRIRLADVISLAQRSPGKQSRPVVQEESDETTWTVVGRARRYRRHHRRLLEDGPYEAALARAAARGTLGRHGTGGAGANLSDDDFVRDVALKNMAEVELSRIALDKATNLDIKSFAQRMIADHGAAGHNLQSVLSGQPIEWPMQLDDKHRKNADELAEKQGADFDRTYVKAMVEGHQDLAAKLEVPTRRAVARRLENGCGGPHGQ